MTVQVRFWWADYSPEKALTTFDLVALETPFEVSQDGGKTWRPRENDTTFETVRDWMRDNDLRVMDTQLGSSRRNGRWEGQYVLTIGKGR